MALLWFWIIQDIVKVAILLMGWAVSILEKSAKPTLDAGYGNNTSFLEELEKDVILF